VDFDELLSEGFDSVVHLAGQPGVRLSWGSDFSSYVRDNIEATQRLLEAIVTHSPRTKVVYASSSSVYGQAESFPTLETTLPRPFSPYGVTKLAGEHLVALYRENFGLNTVSFRFFTVYGPGQRPDMAFTRFFAAVRSQQPITVYGDGTQVRDFTFVGDISRALMLASHATGALPPVMNLSGGSSVSVNNALETIGQVTGRDVITELRPRVSGDVFRTGGDSALALEHLGWSPVTSLHDGLAAQWASIPRN